MTRVTTTHLFTIPGYSRRPGFCRGQSREWARCNGIDWRDFVKNGIDADQLQATGDGMAQALVKWARQCEAREQAALQSIASAGEPPTTQEQAHG